MEDGVYYVYMLRCSDGTLYTGCAIDPAARLEKHNRGTASKYTRSRLPVKMVFCEALPDKGSALRREKAIKGLSRAQKEQLIYAAAHGDVPVGGAGPVRVP